jgi:cobalt-zinc-cadmium efflux system outer membrane protein
MKLRLASWRCVPLVLLLAAGCLYPVREKIDFTLCELAAQPRDVQPTLTDQTPPLMPPASDPDRKSSEVKPTAYRPDENAVLIAQAGGAGAAQKPGAGGADKDLAPGKGSASKTEAGFGGGQTQQLLTVPGELLPSGSPPVAPLNLPKPTKENAAIRRQILERLYPHLTPLGPDPQPLPGPNGRPLTLSDLQRLGLEHNPAVRMAVAAVAAARGAAIQAGLPPNPTVGFEADTFGTSGGAGYQGAFIDQVFKTANKLQLARAVATMDLRNAEVAQRRAEMELATNVRRNYFALLVARESMKVNRALVQFTEQAYEIQVAQAKGGGVAAPYEPAYLRYLTMSARTALVQARNRYVSAWKQLAAAMGMTGMPLTEVAGRVDMPMPDYNFEAVKEHVLKNHTDVRTAENTLLQAQLNLRVARVTPIPDVELRVLVQRDYTGLPFEIAPSVQVSVPVPVWNRNQGGIMQAEANLVSASEGPHLARVNLMTNLSQYYETYRTNVINLAMYRDYMLPDLVRVYQGVYARYQRELLMGGGGGGLVPGPVAPGAPIIGVLGVSTPTLNDVVVAQGNLTTAVAGYVTALGQAWDAAVSITDLIQTNDMFAASQKLQKVGPVPELPPLPCTHPCSSFKGQAFQGADGTWPSALPGKGEPRMPRADEPPAPPGRPGSLPEPTELLPPPQKVPDEGPKKPAGGERPPPAGPELDADSSPGEPAGLSRRDKPGGSPAGVGNHVLPGG